MDGSQSLFCGHDDADNAVAFHHGIDGLGVDQVLATHLVQGVEHRNLQIIDVAPQLVLTDPDSLVAVGLELLKDQLMHFRTRLTARTHLVDWHPQAPGSHSPEKGVVLNQQRVSAFSRRPQRCANSRRAATYHQYIRLIWYAGLFADCQDTLSRS
ncbi:hypothetical protein ES703_61971 [subsurface metagenome]